MRTQPMCGRRHHYCVANMRAAWPALQPSLEQRHTSFAIAIANKGWKKALADDVHLKNGLNVALGTVTYKAVAMTWAIPMCRRTGYLR